MADSLPLNGWSPHRFIKEPQEVDLIIKAIHLGLQLNLVCVGGIHILQRKRRNNGSRGVNQHLLGIATQNQMIW
jgi:hypothetical protein